MKRFTVLRNFFHGPSVTARAVAVALGIFLSVPAVVSAAPSAPVPKWGRFETSLTSAVNYPNPTQQGQVGALFTAPSGEKHKVYGFWDGGQTWRLRFSPTEPGKWTWRTACNDTANAGLHDQQGEFLCTAPANKSRFDQHGPVRVALNGRHLTHADGTPFFWLGDTAWNGALLSTDAEWSQYIKERVRQKFTAVQFVATQFRAAPAGDRDHQLAFTGADKIVLNPAFFQRLDAKFDALNQAGLLAVPVMLWAINGGGNPQVNPGVALPDDQAVLLARYMVARWGAHDVAWILPGDGDYRGAKATRWRNIGFTVFGDIPHAPVLLHPGGMQWVWNEFKDDQWLDIIGYQSGHGDDDKTLRWMTEGPLTEDWARLPHRPFINLEPPYEYHLSYQSKKPIAPETVRRAIYWTLLNAPTAGVTYGGHGVWGWDDGTKPPTDHPGTGIPLPWQKALTMPGAEQMKHLADFFESIEWWRLRPTPAFVVNQPGKEKPARFIAAARTDQKDLLVVYVPEDRTVEIKLDALPPSPQVSWFNPRTGDKSPAVAVVTANTCQFPTPSEGDWILWMYTQKEKDKAKEAADDKASGAGKK